MKLKGLTGKTKAISKLSNTDTKATKAISDGGAIVGFASGAAGFGCPGGIMLSSVIGKLAGDMVRIRVTKRLSKYALRKRLECVVGRPRLADALAKKYSDFPAYQRAILDLGKVKIARDKKVKKKIRKELSAEYMTGSELNDELEKHFREWLRGDKSLFAIIENKWRISKGK